MKIVICKYDGISLMYYEKDYDTIYLNVAPDTDMIDVFRWAHSEIQIRNFFREVRCHA